MKMGEGALNRLIMVNTPQQAGPAQLAASSNSPPPRSVRPLTTFGEQMGLS